MRAKFECLKNAGGQIHLRPVSSGSQENERFFSATPGGQIQMAVLSPPASALFEVGKSYYVDFSAADAPPKHVAHPRSAEPVESDEPRSAEPVESDKPHADRSRRHR